jgi:malic enzyme
MNATCLTALKVSSKPSTRQNFVAAGDGAAGACCSIIVLEGFKALSGFNLSLGEGE